MKKSRRSRVAHDRLKSVRLALRAETLRALTAQELVLVAAGNCLNGSYDSQRTTLNLAGTC